MPGRRRRRPAPAATAPPEAPTPPLDPSAAAFFDVDNTMMQGASIYWFARGLAARKYVTFGDLVGFALWHSTPLAAGRPKDELRVLKLVARDLRAFDRILDALPAAAAAEKVGRVAIRCQTEFVAAYQRLVSPRLRG